ncbi:MAG: adenylosuccinate lyase [Spirochaetota bacterium]
MSGMLSISPLDGRYNDKLSHLSKYFSEFALMNYRCGIELLYVLALDETKIFPKLTTEEKKRIGKQINNFSETDYYKIKQIEKKSNHDVKACEIFLREKMKLQNPNMIHFGLTSEDINNLSYNLLLKDYMQKEHIPQIEKLIKILYYQALKWIKIPFPCRTHGQKASPSTAGKEIAVYLNRLLRQYRKLKKFYFRGKLNGAVGNFSALLSAFPNYDWMNFSIKFIKTLELNPNIVSTQIEDHDTWAEYFHIVNQINNIVMDINIDFWLYISFNLFKEKPNPEEIGSSTMPHKVNPINFENSEGNITLSNSLLNTISDKLTHSRMQRDLSDSTVSRNIGTALAYSHLAINETIKGLGKITINEEKCYEELNTSPELLAEPIQTILKTAGIKDPYDILKDITRGKKVTQSDIDKFIDELDIGDNYKDKIKSLKVTSYTGDAVRICKYVIQEAQKELNL